MTRPFAALTLLFALASPLAATPPATATPAAAGKSAGYDPARDPERDLAAAIERARAAKKRILLEVGGEWCIWCHILDEFIAAHPSISKALDAGFVLVKVNYSKEQKNEAFLGRYPKVAEYPHLFVLDSDGTFLHSQDTAEFESGKSYDETKLAAFLARWTAAR